MDARGRERIFAGMVAAATAIAGTYVYMGLKTPLPGQDQEVAGGLTVEQHDFVTPDGLMLRVKRYANPGGQPVLFCHGFNGNGFEFDLPREGYNMAGVPGEARLRRLDLLLSRLWGGAVPLRRR